MAWCSCNKKNKKDKNRLVTLENKIEGIERLRLSEEEINYYQTLFLENAHEDKLHVLRENFPELLGLLGTEISENFANRIFDIFSSDGKHIQIGEYLKYLDVYHHGNERERCLTTFQLMDLKKDNIVDFEEFESYIQLIISAITKVHPGAEEDGLTNKDIKRLFQKISNNKEFFTYLEFENVYLKKPHLLSWIDYFKSTEVNILPNLDKNIKMLLILFEKFSSNFEKLLSTEILNPLSQSQPQFEYSKLINEINKFIAAVSKVQREFTMENSNFNIRNFFNSKHKHSFNQVKEFNVHDTHNVHNLHNAHNVNKKHSEKNIQKISSDDNLFINRNHKKTFHTVSPFLLNPGERIYMMNGNDDTDYIKEQLNNLKQTLIDDNLNLTKENKSEIVLDKSQENFNLSSLDNKCDIEIIPSEPDLYNELSERINEEQKLGKFRISDLKKELKTTVGFTLTDTCNSIPLEEIKLKSKRDKVNTCYSNGKPTISTNLESARERSYQTEEENILREKLDTCNREMKIFLEKLLELFKFNSCLINWVLASYKWIDEKHINNLIKKEKKKTQRSENYVNKPVTEKIIRKKILKSKNNLIKFTDENFAIILNMIMGIQLSVESTSNITLDNDSDLCPYLRSNKFSLPSANFHSAHLEGIFYISSFATVIFHNIRKIREIDKETYIQSLSPQDFIAEMIVSSSSNIDELFSTSKSGSLFYHTRDGKYILKTIAYKEYRCLKNILSNYFYHVYNNKFTLLPIFYGLHKLVRKVNHKKTMYYFLVMDNVFSTNKKINFKYDLKGSKIGREVLNSLTEKEREKDTLGMALKDLDLDSQGKRFFIGVKKIIFII
jgi:hypothetical protein